MDVDVNRELWLWGHTTADIADVRLAIVYMAELQRLFQVNDLEVVSFDEMLDRQIRLSCASLAPAQLAKFYSEGGITFQSSLNDTFGGGIEWRRIMPDNQSSFLEHQGYRQNEVSLAIRSALLQDSAFRERYLQFCVQVANAFDVNYMYAYHPRTAKRFQTKLQLGVGLHEVHWINILGPPYLEIIPRDRLLTAPAYLVKEIDANRILIQATEQFLPANNNEFLKACDRIRQHIGNEYFTKPVPGAKPRQPDLESGVYSIWRGLWHFWKIRNEFKTETELAEKRPSFDWKNILIDDRTS